MTERISEAMMIKVMQLIYVLTLLGIVNVVVQSQEPTSEYVAPSQAVPKDRAPRMQVQLLSRGEQTKEYAVIFGKGDEAFSGLLEFAEKYHVTSAHFTAIGALNGAKLGWFAIPNAKCTRRFRSTVRSK